MIKTSHIGSLPFIRVEDAQNFNKQFDLPVLFTLPILDQSQFMLKQVVGECSTYCADILKRDITVSNLDSIKDEPQFKYQMVGPVTLIKSLKLIDPNEITKLLSWYLKQLKNLFSETLSTKCYFFLDEPMLFMANQEDYQILNKFISELKSTYMKIGMHCCSEFEPSYINFEQLDGLSLESKYIDLLDLNLDFDLFLGILDTKTLKLDPVISINNLSKKTYVTPHCGLALSGLEKMDMVSKNLTKWANMAQAR